MLAYALPLLSPPSAAESAASGAGVAGRLFPGVPAWWVVGRISCLFAGAALLAWTAPQPRARAIRGAPSDLRREVSLTAVVLAFGVALAHSVCSLWVAHLPMPAQTLYFVLLGVPAAILAFAERLARSAPTFPAGSSGRSTFALSPTAWSVAVLVVAWAVARMVDSLHSPRAADVVDMWRTFGYLARFATQGGNFLNDTIDPEIPGVTATPLFFQGLPLLRLMGQAPSFAWVQIFHVLWLAMCGAGVGLLSARLFGGISAVVAAAVFLCSPFVLMVPLSPTPAFIGPLFSVALGLLVVSVHRGSVAAVAALGAAAGVAITYPALVPIALLAIVLSAIVLHRRPRVPWLVVAAAALTFAAAAIPGLPDADAARAMWSRYAALEGQMAALQEVLFAQVPAVRGSTEAWSAAGSRVLDVPLATLLAPFAVARTPIRLWGDALFDPLGTVLAASGVALCLRFVRRDPIRASLLAALAAALAPGLISSYDKPSLLRVFAAPVPVALLAALGFRSLCDRLRPRARVVAAVATVIAVIAGGTALFDGVNPRILRSSPLGVALRAIDREDLDRAVVLGARDENPPWLYFDTIAAQVPARPIRVLSAQETEELLDEGVRLRAHQDLLLWTPAVEEAAGMSDLVCRRWSTAALYTLTDRTGLTKLRVARPSGHGWVPRIGPTQWRVEGCATSTSSVPDIGPQRRTPEALVGHADMARPSLRGTDLEGVDLSGADLRGKKLAHARLSGTRLGGADLSGADLRGANLAGADLSAANLGGAEMARADLSGASLDKANLAGADLHSAVLREADLTEANLARARLGGADLTGARLAGADFSDAQLVEAKLGRADLSHTILVGANFRAAVLDGANLSGADLTRGDLAGASLAGAKLREADLSGLIVRDVDLSGADLRGAKLTGTDLGGANLTEANLAGAILKDARLAGAVLARADLSRAVLEGADLTGADLSGAVLSGADLSGTNIVGAKLDGLVLAGANLAGAALPGIRMPGAKLAGAVLAGADLHACDLRKADLTEADLKRARLSACDLTAARLPGARLDGAELAGTILDETDLTGVALAEADLGGQRLRGAKLAGASLARSNLTGADLRGADLGGADLREAALSNAKLAGADLRAARLDGAMLAGADLGGANLEGADVSGAYLAGVVWRDSGCPDGTLSSDHGETCCGHHRQTPPASCGP